jgi:hypothetical protein
MAMPSFAPGWCLVLAIWGDKYSDDFVNDLARSARALSGDCSAVVLFTDRIRARIDADIAQRIFPEFFNRPEFYLGGFRVKLSVFSREHLPPNARCLYVDLDSIVVGDLGRIAKLIEKHDDYLMIPPGNLIKFGRLRRLVFRLTNGRRFATGNSSILAYSSAAEPNLCDVFRQEFQHSHGAEPHLGSDDIFISWFAQPTLKGIPPTLGAMFRREFLARSRFMLWLKSARVIARKRRANIVAITFNGAAFKPTEILKLRDGDRIVDGKGRFGFWTEASIGPIKAEIQRYCRRVVANPGA